MMRLFLSSQAVSSSPTVPSRSMVRSSNRMQQPKNIISATKTKPKVQQARASTYVLKIAKMNVPHGKLQLARLGPCAWISCADLVLQGADEQDVEDHERDAEHVGAAGSDAELEDRGEDGVEDGGGEDAFDGAVGVCCVACEADDLGEADGEEDEGDEGGEELEDAEEMEDEVVGSASWSICAGAGLIASHLEFGGQI